jgi:hypothetical protein
MVADDRRCHRCGVLVTNANLGGYSGRSALSGILYCERCAQPDPDTSQPLLPETISILDDISSLERLLQRSWASVQSLRLEPHIVARQASLVLLAREYARDCAVLAYWLNRMALS